MRDALVGISISCGITMFVAAAFITRWEPIAALGIIAALLAIAWRPK